MVIKSFEKWRIGEVERTFGIRFHKKLSLMDKWLDFEKDITIEEKNRIEPLRLLLEEMAIFWGEEDIKVFFIIPIISIVNFYIFDKYRTFMEATFQAEVKDIENNIYNLCGRVEMVVATGKQDPEIPFFFLNEYKAQAKGGFLDPQGQLLIAMLAAQTKNKDINFPIYGMYNIGQNFFFVLLEQKNYTISKQFDATDKQDLEKIVSMLQFVKNHIENIVNSSK